VGPVEDVPYAQELTASVHSSGLSDRITFRGPIAHDDLPQCYREHDILVFPSIGIERFPLVIVEAMASGLPIVTTLTGGQSDFLVDEKNCLVFRPGDAQHLAQRLRLLLDDIGLRADIASAGAETVRTRLSLEQTCSQMEEFLTARLR
jgi:glycosyltransferase involved in cell wall biosynthesis